MELSTRLATFSAAMLLTLQKRLIQISLVSLNTRSVDLDSEGFVPVMFAAEQGNAAGVSYPLQSQAHAVNQCRVFGKETALNLPAQRGFPQTIRVLLAAGADPHRRNALGLSALEFAYNHRPSLHEMHKPNTSTPRAVPWPKSRHSSV
jgi:ankyrin repeat protein